MTSTSGGHLGHHFHGTHYVISEDVDLVVAAWCREMGLRPPSPALYRTLRAHMKDMLGKFFARVTMIGSDEIRKGLQQAVARYKKAGLKIICLERAYLKDSEIHGRIELTRTVDQDGNDILIHGVRDGTAVKGAQFSCFPEQNVALIEDVVFSGKTLIATISELHRYHTNVHAVAAAIGVKDGVEALKKQTFGVSGMPDHMKIDCLEEFDDLSDQVCERDFYPGVPYSGRQFAFDNKAFPYILPFGKPEKWASIPVKEAKRFSLMCLDNTIALFSAIEKMNGKKITCAMIPRPVYGLPNDKTRFVTALEDARERCLKL